MKASKKKRSATGKSTGKAKTVEDYLSCVPQPARGTLVEMRATILSAAPAGATDVISYGIPAVRTSEVLVWYGAFAKHCSFFSTRAVIEKFKDELKGYTLSRGTIQFPVDQPLPASLVRKMVKARVQDAEKKRKK